MDGIVEMVLGATTNFGKFFTQDRLFAWHAELFPTGYSNLSTIRTGSWRDDATGAM
ncbi:hypothetical protein [Solimicrobium silvestre]|uniref:hypothetical protein n=1 Tax=Solimicrobium silvestre TaxID=2099400 RepID=UPI0013FE03DA